MTTQLAFHDVNFNVVNRNGQIWLTSAELASALQYSNVRAVTVLYNRYKDEFTEAMSLVLKMNTKGFGGGNSEKDTRIFSLRGAHLVAMLSKTPVAKEFRRWVLDILDRESGNPTASPVTPGDYAIVTYFKNGLPVSSRPCAPGEIMMDPDSCFEHVMRCGHVIIPWHEIGKLTMDEIYEMTERVRVLSQKVSEQHRELVKRYDI